MLKISFGVAFGILLATLVIVAGKVWFISAVFDGLADNLKQWRQTSIPVSVPSRVDTPEIAQLPTREAVKAGEQMGQGMPPQNPRNEQIRIKSENAVLQARAETQGFNAQYKRPEECYNMKDAATRINCANAYMRARRAFDGRARQ
jgi:hypothetical protein